MSTATDGCDGAFWQIMHTVTNECVQSEVCTTLYNFSEEKNKSNRKKVKPSENHGFYKYDVLMVQDDPKIKNAEVISAYIGDVEYFINNQAKAGRVGLLVKKGIIPNKSVKKMFNLILKNMEFPTKNIKTLVSQVK